MQAIKATATYRNLDILKDVPAPGQIGQFLHVPRQVEVRADRFNYIDPDTVITAEQLRECMIKPAKAVADFLDGNGLIVCIETGGLGVFKGTDAEPMFESVLMGQLGEDEIPRLQEWVPTERWKKLAQSGQQIPTPKLVRRDFEQILKSGYGWATVFVANYTSHLGLVNENGYARVIAQLNAELLQYCIETGTRVAFIEDVGYTNGTHFMLFSDLKYRGFDPKNAMIFELVQRHGTQPLWPRLVPKEQIVVGMHIDLLHDDDPMQLQIAELNVLGYHQNTNDEVHKTHGPVCLTFHEGKECVLPRQLTTVAEPQEQLVGA